MQFLYSQFLLSPCLDDYETILKYIILIKYLLSIYMLVNLDQIHNMVFKRL